MCMQTAAWVFSVIDGVFTVANTRRLEGHRFGEVAACKYHNGSLGSCISFDNIQGLLKTYSHRLTTNTVRQKLKPVEKVVSTVEPR